MSWSLNRDCPPSTSSSSPSRSPSLSPRRSSRRLRRAREATASSKRLMGSRLPSCFWFLLRELRPGQRALNRKHGDSGLSPLESGRDFQGRPSRSGRWLSAFSGDGNAPMVDHHSGGEGRKRDRSSKRESRRRPSARAPQVSSPSGSPRLTSRGTRYLSESNRAQEYDEACCDPGNLVS